MCVSYLRAPGVSGCHGCLTHTDEVLLSKKGQDGLTETKSLQWNCQSIILSVQWAARPKVPAAHKCPADCSCLRFLGFLTLALFVPSAPFSKSKVNLGSHSISSSVAFHCVLRSTLALEPLCTHARSHSHLLASTQAATLKPENTSICVCLPPMCFSSRFWCYL
jgi:hypothetical protein